MTKRIRIIRITLVFLATIIYCYNDIIRQTTVLELNSHNDAQKGMTSSTVLPPLTELVQSNSDVNTPCPFGTAPILDQISQNYEFTNTKRKIPQILHFTSKTRCATPRVIDNINLWRRKFPNHSIYLHDDRAVDLLTNHPLSHSIFPLLNETLKCVTSGATKADIWRYLLLYLYGGIYSDVDNTPMKYLNESTISAQDEFFSPIEGLGILSQFFFASAPRHPLMKLALNAALDRLRSTENVMRNNPAQTTGPGALKVGLIYFLNGTDGYIPAGRYEGVNGWSVTLVGRKENHTDYIQRDGLRRKDKMEYYSAIGGSHFSSNRYPRKGGVSCMEHLNRTRGSNLVANYSFNSVQYVGY